MLDSKFVYQNICPKDHQGKINFPESSNLWRSYACVVCSIKAACVKFTRALSFQSKYLMVSACVAIYLGSKNIFILIKFICECYDEWLQDGQEIHN